jgi:hypothetical protein
MKCSLCLQEIKLIKKSHIVPDYLFKDFLDEKHRMVEVSFKDKTMKGHPVQSSHWESDFLCQDCDNVKLSQLEGYFKTNIFYPVVEYSKNLPPPIRNTSVFFPADYQQIKLFFLSLLWRMSVIKNLKYKTVDLGKHEEIIRKMINENNPKGIYDYPFILYSFINKENFDKPISVIKVSRTPHLQKINNGHEYATLLPGIFFIIRISRLTDKRYVEVSLKEKDKIAVYFPPEQESKNLVNKWMGAKVF